ncbi:MAG TPA: dTMP kinase [Acidimicrobiales bacterium]|nr:dTMP kinase [Acidimicrobiales bacterium]
MTRGSFIALEGGEASGKSTQAARLAARLDAVLTREPGGTPIGERIRALLLDPGTAVDPRAEALLMAAARAQHVHEVIEPALAAGRHVVTDRFTASSLAYQGFGRGLPADEVRALSRFATGGLEPDLYVLLDLAPDVAAERRSREHDRMEAAGEAFHRRVRDGFLALADERWLVVDGSLPVEDIEATIWSRVAKMVR